MSFNQTCKVEGLVPKSLRLKTPVASAWGHKIIRQAERKLLAARVQECRQKIKDLETETFFERRQLEHTILQDFPDVQLHANFMVTLRDRQCRKSQESKLDALRPKEPTQTREVILNLSSYKPTESEAALLRKGLNFNTGASPNPARVICTVERAVTQLPSEVREEARTRAIGVLSKWRTRNPQARFSPAEKQAVEGLRNNDSIAILPADKGNAIVLLDRSDYNEKMKDLLSDEDTYVAIQKDPTVNLQTKLQKLLSKVFKFVPPQQKHLYHRLLCTNGSAPAIYGLPKVHKPGVPLRPIVDFTRSPLHRLSGYLHQVLGPLTGKTATHISNSSAFVEKVRDISLDEDDIMVSFDVKSLFTSVPVDLAVATCRDVLLADDTLAERTPLEVEDICELLDFCLSNTYFTYNKQFYRQINGTAMGASISVTTANLVMEVIEQKALTNFAPAPKVFVRYVDDCFCIVRKPDASRLLRLLNSADAAIQFTTEYECDNSHPFLDVLVRRSGTRLSFAVHRKATHTGQYLNFNSCHPACHKQSVVSSLVTRATRICSNDHEMQNELKKIRHELSRNGYPKKFIDKLEARVLHPQPSQGKSCMKRAGVPYVPGVSEALSRVF
ncbi:uncharacterized protein LOC142557893 [Dermacentor variabilis]|uniref:uncharacterized protein LOC142557893 n=1 Tax=Dermacentor variabilis TaxID=34621 RepID=UPI003F5B4906